MTWRELREVSKVAKWLRKIVPFTKKMSMFDPYLYISFQKDQISSTPIATTRKRRELLALSKLESLLNTAKIC